MLPIYLSIEGFYSYQQKQEIDFSALTEAGLFGIFGAVGSGKSSILEAISYALYGDTERLNRQERRGYNMLNLQSKHARIVFDFINFEGKKFRFTAQWKRRASKFDETTSLERMAYQWLEGRWTPLESADGARVTQLSYPNFRRTIIIPQGKFKEFLELGGKDRSIMMKEIFQLEKFDLGPKAAFLLQECNRKLEHLLGALSGYESISADLLAAKEKELAEVTENLTRARQDLFNKQQHLEKLEKAQERQAALTDRKVKLGALLAQRESVEQREKELDRYENTVLLFKELLAQAQRLSSEKEMLTKTVEMLTLERKELSEAVEQLSNKFANTEKQYQSLGELRTAAEDYRILASIQQNQFNLQKAESNLEKGKPIIAAAKEKTMMLKELTRKSEEELEALKAQEFDTHLLIDIETWYTTRDNIAGQLSRVSAQVDSTRAEVEQLKKQFVVHGYTWHDWEQQIALELDKLMQEVDRLKNEQTHLQVQVRLGEFAQELREGDACPLCGAIEHPYPMDAGEANIQLENNKQKSLALVQEINKLKLLEKELQTIANSLIRKSGELQQCETERQNMIQTAETHKQQFSWQDYSPTDKSLFERQKKHIRERQEQIKSAERQLKAHRQELDNQQEQLEKYEARFRELQSQVSVLAARVDQNKNQLRVLDYQTFSLSSPHELQQLSQKTVEKIQQVENDYVQIGNHLNQKKQELAGLAAQLSTAKARFGTVREEAAEKQQLIAALLSKHQYADLYEVQCILKQNLPVQPIRSEINQFYVQLQVLEQQVAELEKIAAEDNFSLEELHAVRDAFQTGKTEVERLLSLSGGLEKELARMTIEYTQKEKLLEEYASLEKRATNLRLLDNLFRGNGFVNHVSTIHIQRLCEIANERFHRLTKNQLSLTINESNEFEVIDFLNNGHKRSVKTLSGGQAFQASLCLALALAENIQTRHKLEKNFFFIDEGFGTQDTESINTVFDTLQYLHRENRIVGIISHVDELKERIPKSVTVVKDTEKGSLVTMN